MKKIVFFIFLILVLSSATLAMNCFITDVCPNDQIVFRMSGPSDNSHAGLWNSTYTWKVCCNETTTGRDCTGTNGVVNLSDTINAHTELAPGINYKYGVCFGQLNCSSATDCGTNECLVSIYEGTIGNCSAYTNKICCQESILGGCAGSINGTVKGIEGNDLDYAKISLLSTSSLEEVYPPPAYTNSQGFYEKPDVPCGTYHVTASKEGYISSTKTNVYVPAEGVNFTLAPGTTCEADCTYLEDEQCHRECQGENNCSFYDNTTRDKCDLAQVGWEREYNLSHELTCCVGAPTPKKEKKTAEVACSKDKLVEITRIVRYKGKPVNVVVVVCK